MLQGYSLPRTPQGRSCLVPTPPWHYAGDALVIEYEADPALAGSFLPPDLELESPRCAVYFMDWQFASDDGEEFLDPSRSQYQETILLLSATYHGKSVSYCPFIWVDQDASMMRGLIQGWPKQVGSTWITRTHSIASKASPCLGAGGRFGASLCVKDRRLMEAVVTLEAPCQQPPSPGMARAVNVRYFPDLAAGRHTTPLVHDLVQLSSRDVRVSEIWSGPAELHFSEHPFLELPDLKPTRVLAGYRFSVALTVDDLVVLKRFTEI